MTCYSREKVCIGFLKCDFGDAEVHYFPAQVRFSEFCEDRFAENCTGNGAENRRSLARWIMDWRVGGNWFTYELRKSLTIGQVVNFG